ncbi:hypothetical protein QAD02_006443, partial [Eretmocerus hayati]
VKLMAGAWKHSLPFNLTRRGLRMSQNITRYNNFGTQICDVSIGLQDFISIFGGEICENSGSGMPGQIDEVRGKRATFGMGCFWAGDSLFGATPGVIRTCVGYAGGTKDKPVYRNLGDHTEVIDVEYDPEKITYSQLLDLFWNNHEYGLTTLIKRQYMSLILYHDEEQRITAEKSRDRQQKEKNTKFTTEISEFRKFYPAEDYHQKYRLQEHPWLVEAIGIKNSEQLQSSPVAAKLNGFLSGATSIAEFEREAPSLGLDDKALAYTRKFVIERQGHGLYC